MQLLSFPAPLPLAYRSTDQTPPRYHPLLYRHSLIHPRANVLVLSLSCLTPLCCTAVPQLHCLVCGTAPSVLFPSLQGHVYLKFSTQQAAEAATRTFHGRYYSGAAVISSEQLGSLVVSEANWDKWVLGQRTE